MLDVDDQSLLHLQFLFFLQYQLLLRAQENLEFVLDNATDAPELGRILMKISANPSDIIVTKYAFFLIEEILGLSGDYSVVVSSSAGKKAAQDRKSVV